MLVVPSVDVQDRFKRSRQTGKLNLSNAELSAFPEKLCDINRMSFDSQKWWELYPLEHMNLAHNTIAEIPTDINKLVDLVSVNISYNQLATVPLSLFELQKLTHIDISHNVLTSFPLPNPNSSDGPPAWPSLSHLVMADNRLSSLPDTLATLPKLEVLDIRENLLESLPENIGRLPLTTLRLSKNKLKKLPNSISELTKLSLLEAKGNLICSVPGLSGLTRLATLDLSQNRLESLPTLPTEELMELFLGFNLLSDCSSLSECRALVTLVLSSNRIAKIPESIAELKKLKVLDLTGNNLNDIPGIIGTMDDLSRLLVDGNPLRRIRKGILDKGCTELKRYLVSRIPNDDPPSTPGSSMSTPRSSTPFSPRGVPSGACAGGLSEEWSARVQHGPGGLTMRANGMGVEVLPVAVFGEALKHLDLRDNSIVTVPHEIVNLSQTLCILHLSSNALSDLPDVICDLRKLKELSLNKNTLTELPNRFDNLSFLDVLDLSQNRFTDCPPMLGRIRSLKNLNISRNQITNADCLWIKRSSLEVVNVANNKITTISPLVRRLKQLSLLDLQNNDVRHLPPELSLCSKLQNMPVSGNPLRRMKYSLIQSGSTAVLQWLKTRLPLDHVESDSDDDMDTDVAPLPPLESVESVAPTQLDFGSGVAPTPVESGAVVAPQRLNSGRINSESAPSSDPPQGDAMEICEQGGRVYAERKSQHQSESSAPLSLFDVQQSGMFSNVTAPIGSIFGVQQCDSHAAASNTDDRPAQQTEPVTQSNGHIDPRSYTPIRDRQASPIPESTPMQSDETQSTSKLDELRERVKELEKEVEQFSLSRAMKQKMKRKLQLARAAVYREEDNIKAGR
eukprot:54976_1